MTAGYFSDIYIGLKLRVSNTNKKLCLEKSYKNCRENIFYKKHKISSVTISKKLFWFSDL